jgi:3'(2'), 5'-bisphosphate nucleotidase
MGETEQRPDGSDEMLAAFETLALMAGAAATAVCAAAFEVDRKADDSPVTRADREAEAIILAGLAKEFPEIPYVAEEEAAAGEATDVGERDFFLVDPLDGTKEFVARRTDYTVNIAFISKGMPLVGVVYAPGRNRLYLGAPGRAFEIVTDEGHQVVSRRPIKVRGRQTPPVIVASRSHRTPDTDSFITSFPTAELVSVGSSLKFCMIAAGDADLYPRFGPTMQWDTAAGDAVLRAAGGSTRTIAGADLTYGPRHSGGSLLYANPNFIAQGRVDD